MRSCRTWTFVSKCTFWNDVKVVPVLDVGDAAQIFHTSLG